ncbi:MAG TPA: UDP-2,3-diacylglucosamine diphosphatase [Bacteroidetes bacterium]|nr:UDP-2,3-diacylglucosamine diphosphatase [Bacteroidota bacterium]
MKRKKIYFVSDFHLGIPDHAGSLEREKRLVKWLETVRSDAEEIFLMGDIFDFWFEYKTVVPKGFVRLMGKLAEITDAGIPVHLFRGNHDLWAFDYLEKEVGIRLYRKPLIRDLLGKTFYLAHGDGLGPGDRNYKLLKAVFEFRPNQFLFRWLHPDVGAWMGNYFSRRSRLAKMSRAGAEEASFDKEKEMLFRHARSMAKEFPEVAFFVFGHRHMPVITPLDTKTKLVILGDWISHFSYGVFDGENFLLETFKG